MLVLILACLINYAHVVQGKDSIENNISERHNDTDIYNVTSLLYNDNPKRRKLLVYDGFEFTDSWDTPMGTELYAGQQYGFMVTADGAIPTSGKALLVTGISETEANAEMCPQAAFPDTGSPLDGSVNIPVSDNNLIAKWPFDNGAVMRHGGTFKVCFSGGGTFGYKCFNFGV